MESITRHVQIQRWAGAAPPTEAALREKMTAAGLTPIRWENGPHEVYDAHTHSYEKVLYVVSGHIIFGFPIDGKPVMLYPGDRLELPAHLLHNAAVGADGVVCLEAHR